MQPSHRTAQPSAKSACTTIPRHRPTDLPPTPVSPCRQARLHCSHVAQARGDGSAPLVHAAPEGRLNLSRPRRRSGRFFASPTTGLRPVATWQAPPTGRTGPTVWPGRFSGPARGRILNPGRALVNLYPCQKSLGPNGRAGLKNPRGDPALWTRGLSIAATTWRN